MTWNCVGVLWSELQNVNFFTQIISVQLNLPQEKARKHFATLSTTIGVEEKTSIAL